MQITNRTGLLSVALLAKGHGLVYGRARTDHHIGSRRFACRLPVGLIVEPLFVLELVDDDGCIRIRISFRRLLVAARGRLLGWADHIRVI